MKKTEIYQIAVDKNVLMQCNVIRTKNDKIIVIDSGHDVSGDYLPHAIRAILGLNQNEYFEIECLFLSHGHNDHYGVLKNMLLSYDKNSNYKINNFYFDFPEFEKMPFHPSDFNLEDLELLKKAFDNYARVNGIESPIRYFDYLNGRVVNKEAIEKGLTIPVDQLDLDILQTRDDSDGLVNGNSVVIRLKEYLNGQKTEYKSVLFLNDTSLQSGQRLLNAYGDKLKSDVVQMAHHGQAGASEEVYKTIDAKIRLWPVPYWVWTRPDVYKIGEVRDWFNLTEKGSENDLITCLYGDYASDINSTEDWKKCVHKMKIEL